jgi:hypothetical protein
MASNPGRELAIQQNGLASLLLMKTVNHLSNNFDETLNVLSLSTPYVSNASCGDIQISRCGGADPSSDKANFPPQLENRWAFEQSRGDQDPRT